MPKLNVHIRDDTNDHFNIIYLIIMNINLYMNLNKENDEMSKPLVLLKNTTNIKTFTCGPYPAKTCPGI